MTSANQTYRQIGAVMVGPAEKEPSMKQRIAIRRHYSRMTLEQRVKHREIVNELRRLERAWNLLDALHPASKHYIKSRVNDDPRF